MSDVASNGLLPFKTPSDLNLPRIHRGETQPSVQIILGRTPGERDFLPSRCQNELASNIPAWESAAFHGGRHMKERRILGGKKTIRLRYLKYI